jgi:hypothetical protein
LFVPVCIVCVCGIFTFTAHFRLRDVLTLRYIHTLPSPPSFPPSLPHFMRSLARTHIRTRTITHARSHTQIHARPHTHTPKIELFCNLCASAFMLACASAWVHSRMACIICGCALVGMGVNVDLGLGVWLRLGQQGLRQARALEHYQSGSIREGERGGGVIG